MSIVKEFRDFALKGNVVDMAVGIVIGAAFGNVVNSMVNDVMTPPLGYLIGGVDFSSLEIVLKPATETNPAVSIRYGLFINKLINFLIQAWAIFFVIKVMNRLRHRDEAKKVEDKKA